MSWCGNDLSNVYDPEFVVDCIKYAEMDKRKLENYINDAKSRLQMLNAMKWENVVTIVYSKFNRVHYFVAAIRRAVEDPAICYFLPDHSRRFPGNEKKAAVEYAEELAKKLNAKLMKDGFE